MMSQQQRGVKRQKGQTDSWQGQKGEKDGTWKIVTWSWDLESWFCGMGLERCKLLRAALALQSRATPDMAQFGSPERLAHTCKAYVYSALHPRLLLESHPMFFFPTTSLRWLRYIRKSKVEMVFLYTTIGCRAGSFPRVLSGLNCSWRRKNHWVREVGTKGGIDRFFRWGAIRLPSRISRVMHLGQWPTASGRRGYWRRWRS